MSVGPDQEDTSPHRPALLRVDSLRTWFVTPRGAVRAVDGVDLTLDRGRTIGIVGESGSGKSVLSRSIMGLLPREGVVRGGVVEFRGVDISTLPRKRLRKLWGNEIAMVLQDPMTSLNPVMKIGNQLSEGLRQHEGLSARSAAAEAQRLLEEVGISDPRRRMEQYPHELSGGMRQRVTIASALSCSPELLIADEPTTALDVTVQAQLLDLLAFEQRQRNMSMVLVTHDLGIVAGRTDEVAVMYAGKIVERAPTRTLFANVKMRYTEALLASIPRLDGPRNAPLRPIPGRPPGLIDPARGCRFAPRCVHASDLCRSEEPPLVHAESVDHVYACWHPVGSGQSPAPVDVSASGHISPKAPA